jgi:hypothetical protein
MEPAAQFRAAFVRFRKITGLRSSSFVTLPSKVAWSGRPFPWYSMLLAWSA